MSLGLPERSYMGLRGISRARVAFGTGTAELE
jgi:hypothetical protein